MGILEQINSKLDTILSEVKKDDPFLPSEKIAEYLNVSPKSFYNYIHRLKDFGLSKPAGRWGMFKSDLDRFIKEGR